MMWDSVEISDIVEGFFIPFVAVFGILGNVASICVLRDNRLEMKATFRYFKLTFNHSMDLGIARSVIVCMTFVLLRITCSVIALMSMTFVLLSLRQIC